MVQIIPGSIGGIVVRVTDLQLTIRTITNSTTLLSTDYTIEADASLGVPIIVTLPTAASQFDGALSIGRVYNIKKIDNTPTIVTILPQGADLIDTLASLVISAQDVSYMIQSDGTKWVRL